MSELFAPDCIIGADAGTGAGTGCGSETGLNDEELFCAWVIWAKKTNDVIAKTGDTTCDIKDIFKFG